MSRIRAVLRRLERTILGSFMRIGAKVANRRVAREINAKRAGRTEE